MCADGNSGTVMVRDAGFLWVGVSLFPKVSETHSRCVFFFQQIDNYPEKGRFFFPFGRKPRTVSKGKAYRFQSLTQSRQGQLAGQQTQKSATTTNTDFILVEMCSVFQDSPARQSFLLGVVSKPQGRQTLFTSRDLRRILHSRGKCCKDTCGHPNLVLIVQRVCWMRRTVVNDFWCTKLAHNVIAPHT